MRHFARFSTPFLLCLSPARETSLSNLQIPSPTFALRLLPKPNHHIFVSSVDTMVAVHNLVPVLMSSIPSSLTTVPLWVDLCGRLAPALSVAVFMAPIRKYLI
jgi:hypothetical protein